MLNNTKIAYIRRNSACKYKQKKTKNNPYLELFFFKVRYITLDGRNPKKLT